MTGSESENKLYYKYLELLELKKEAPTFDCLKKIVKAQNYKIPYENISKLYFKKKIKLKSLISFELFLEGVEKHNFGGTCYSNNHYLNKLLNWLGFEVKLCGATMKEPDVHLVNIVNINDREFLVDAGLAAPFFEPIPMNMAKDYIIDIGTSRYVLRAHKKDEWPVMEIYRNNELVHGYKVNAKARNINEFSQIIQESFLEDSTFMKSTLLTRYSENYAVILHNYSLTEIYNNEVKATTIESHEQLASEIEKHFGISRKIALESIEKIRF